MNIYNGETLKENTPSRSTLVLENKITGVKKMGYAVNPRPKNMNCYKYYYCRSKPMKEIWKDLISTIDKKISCSNNNRILMDLIKQKSLLCYALDMVKK